MQCEPASIEKPPHHHDFKNEEIQACGFHRMRAQHGIKKNPDIMIFRLDQSNNLQIAYIECKQKNPKFNNNPPKMNKNCIYVCGNKMFNGFLLTTQEWQDRKNEFIIKYNLNVLYVVPIDRLDLRIFI